MLRGPVCARVIATPSHNNAPGQCCDKGGEVINKLLIEVGKSYKGSYVFDVFKFLPVYNYFNLL